MQEAGRQEASPDAIPDPDAGSGRDVQNMAASLKKKAAARAQFMADPEPGLGMLLATDGIAAPDFGAGVPKKHKAKRKAASEGVKSKKKTRVESDL